MSRRLTATLMLLIVSVIWGAASPVVKFTLQWFDPWIFLTYRFFISTAIAIPYLWLTRTRMPTKSGAAGLVLLTGFVSAPLSLWLFFEALTKTSALSGSLLTAVGPLLLIFGGALIFHDRVTRNERTGMVIALAGALVTVLGPLVLNGHTDTLGKLEGNLIMLAAVVTDSIATLLSKEAVRKNISATLLAQTQFIIGFALFVPVILIKYPASEIISIITSAPLAAHLGVLFMAVLSGTLAYSLRNIAVKSIEVSESAIFSYLQPLWAAILAVLWLNEPVTKPYIIGGVIILAGILVTQRRKRKR